MADIKVEERGRDEIEKQDHVRKPMPARNADQQVACDHAGEHNAQGGQQIMHGVAAAAGQKEYGKQQQLRAHGALQRKHHKIQPHRPAGPVAIRCKWSESVLWDQSSRAM